MKDGKSKIITEKQFVEMLDRAFNLLRSTFAYSRSQTLAIIREAVKRACEAEPKKDYITQRDFVQSLIDLVRYKCN